MSCHVMSCHVTRGLEFFVMTLQHFHLASLLRAVLTHSNLLECWSQVQEVMLQRCSTAVFNASRTSKTCQREESSDRRGTTTHARNEVFDLAVLCLPSAVFLLRSVTGGFQPPPRCLHRHEHGRCHHFVHWFVSNPSHVLLLRSCERGAHTLHCHLLSTCARKVASIGSNFVTQVQS